jgi:hypothetical protein
MQGAVDLQALADAISRGDYDGALRTLGVDVGFAQALQGVGAEGLKSFQNAVQGAYLAGGQAAIQTLPRQAAVNGVFDLLNPRSIDFIRSYSFALIHDISDTQRELIRNILMRAFTEGGHPFQQAREIRNSIGLTPRQEQAVANYRKALQNNSMIALQRELRDRRFDRSVNGAINAGQPLDQGRIDKLVDRYRERYINYRGKVIARTECLLPETLVDGAVVRAAFRRWYDGPVVTLGTQGGRQFAATPNHPMLTQRGWMGAGEVTERDYLICNAFKEDVGSSRNVNQKAPPAPIGKIFDALQRSGRVERASATTLDFHGDGSKGDVNTASSDGELLVGRFAPLYQPTVDFLLAESGFEGTSFCGFCKALLPVNQRITFGSGAQLCLGCVQDAVYCAAGTLILGCELGRWFALGVPSGDLLRREIRAKVPRPASAFVPSMPSFSQGARYARFLDYASDPTGIGTNPHLLGDLLRAQSAQIQLDRVSLIGLREFSGHVYNLETPYGYFTISAAYTGNTIRAANQGQREIWNQARDQGLLDDGQQRMWVASGDANTCPECAALDGTTVGMDEEFPEGDPPLHPS